MRSGSRLKKQSGTPINDVKKWPAANDGKRLSGASERKQKLDTNEGKKRDAISINGMSQPMPPGVPARHREVQPIKERPTITRLPLEQRQFG